VDPKPLIRVSPNVILDYTRETSSVLDDVRLFVSGAPEFDGWLKAQAILLQIAIPREKARHNSRIRAERDPREA
jgi:hypothetical protein